MPLRQPASSEVARTGDHLRSWVSARGDETQLRPEGGEAIGAGSAGRSREPPTCTPPGSGAPFRASMLARPWRTDRRGATNGCSSPRSRRRTPCASAASRRRGRRSPVSARCRWRPAARLVGVERTDAGIASTVPAPAHATMRSNVKSRDAFALGLPLRAALAQTLSTPRRGVGSSRRVPPALRVENMPPTPDLRPGRAARLARSRRGPPVRCRRGVARVRPNSATAQASRKRFNSGPRAPSRRL